MKEKIEKTHIFTTVIVLGIFLFRFFISNFSVEFDAVLHFTLIFDFSKSAHFLEIKRQLPLISRIILHKNSKVSVTKIFLIKEKYASKSLTLVELWFRYTGCPRKIVPRLPEDCDKTTKDSN